MIFVVVDSNRILPENISNIIYQLSSEGAVNFAFIAQELQKVYLPEELKAEVAQLVVAKIIFSIKCGAWKDLRGAKELIKFLDVEKIKLTDKWARLVGEYYTNFSYYFLTSLCPSLINGEYWDGKKYRKYDKMEYAREKIKKLGVPESKLTDSYIECLWNVRELLLLMHLNHVIINGRPSIEGILSIVEPIGQLAKA